MNIDVVIVLLMFAVLLVGIWCCLYRSYKDYEQTNGKFKSLPQSPTDDEMERLRAKQDMFTGDRNG